MKRYFIDCEFDGHNAPNTTPLMHFKVYDVDCYPTELHSALQHNAYWDALALRANFL